MRINQAFFFIKRLLTSPLSDSEIPRSVRNPSKSSIKICNPKELITHFFHPEKQKKQQRISTGYKEWFNRFSSLPDGTVDNIFSYICIQSINNVMVVCKNWKDTVKNEYWYISQTSNNSFAKKYHDALKSKKVDTSYVQVLKNKNKNNIKKHFANVLL